MSGKISSGGIGAILATLKHVQKETGLMRGARALSSMNSQGGFDCPGCAWPEPDHRARFEFCENGAKALMSATTTKLIDENFWRTNSVSDLQAMPDHTLEEQGRLVVPAIRRAQDKYFSPLSYEEALDIIAASLRDIKDPNEAVFYTSGRASNEAAFLFQLFARLYGTNNLCDCSNLCHESSGVAMQKSIGVGKGTVQISDFEKAQVIFLIGHNPSTNHPRMLSTLREAKKNGASIVVINPLLEPGLMKFRHPQKVGDFVGSPFALATHYYQPKVGGDAALFYLLLKIITQNDQTLDHDFINNHTQGFLELKKALEKLDTNSLLDRCGLSTQEITQISALITGNKRVIYAWGMGITQSIDAVSTIEAVVSCALAQGQIGIEGAGLCPVRGHSNVQGNRSVGITHFPDEDFNNYLTQRFNFVPPNKAGLDVVDSIKAMAQAQVKLFMALGGNFLSASPDYTPTKKALESCKLLVSVSTKLNRTHLCDAETVIILPTLTRVEKDIQNGVSQKISVENSMGIVHASTGNLNPLRQNIASEPWLIAELAQRVLPHNKTIDWQAMSNDYALIREHIAATIPAFANYNQNLDQPNGFMLPNAARMRIFNTKSQKAEFIKLRPLSPINQEHDLILTTIRSHDQFNTAIYGLNDRYRGISNQRDVVFMNTLDIARLKLAPNMRVDLLSIFDEKERVLKNLQVKPYDIKAGSAACYFPEGNILIPLESVAHESNTPSSKQIPVRVRKS